MAEAWNMRLVGHSDLAGAGGLMQVNIKDGYAFVGHMGERGTSIMEVRDPAGRISSDGSRPTRTPTVTRSRSSMTVS